MESLSHSMAGLFRTSSDTRRLSEERQAREDHNHNKSHLHNLPIELLILIGQYARGLSLSALRQTCHRLREVYTAHASPWHVKEFGTMFYCNLDTLEPGYFDGNDLSRWRLALRRDRYRDKCRREKPKASPSKLRCSSCCVKHPRSYFVDDELTANSETRLCKAAIFGGLQTCNHLLLPFIALQRLRVPEAATDPSFGALAGKHRDSSAECPTVMGVHFSSQTRKREFLHPTLGGDGNAPCLEEPVRYTEPWSYKVVLQYTMLRHAPKADVYVSVVAQKLRTLTGMVCQHIPMSGPEVLRSFYPGTLKAALTSSSTVRWINDWQHTLPRDYRCTQIRSCRQPDSDTKFRLALEVDARGNQQIHLLVQRDVGRLEDAHDPKWLSQRTIPLGIHP